MSRFPLLVIAFVVTPLVELALLVRLGVLVGFWPTVGLVLLTGIIGATLAKRQGLATWTRFQHSLADGRLPKDAILDGLIILVSAALLLTPGVLTDLVGFVGLIPRTRSVVRRQLSYRLRERLKGNIWTSRSPVAANGAERSSSVNGWQGQPSRHPRHTSQAVGGSR